MISTRKTRAMATAREMRFKDVERDSAVYRKANNFLIELRKHWRNREITGQQYSTIRGQALAGDMDGAAKGLARVIAENCNRREREQA